MNWWWLLFSHINRSAADGDGGGDGGAFDIEAVRFDGATAFAVSTSAGIFDATEGDKYTYSVWVRTYDSTGDNNLPVHASELIGVVARSGFFAYSSTQAAYRLAAHNGEIGTVDGGGAPHDHAWQHWLFAYDKATDELKVYVNDVEKTYTPATSAAPAANDPYQIFQVGARRSGIETWAAGSFWQGEMAELWVDFTTAIDIDVTANRRLFIGSDGKPADVGASGAIPLGAVPHGYYSVRVGGTATDFLTNRGVGEATNITEGLLILASTSPND